jgi:hypothetical protein
MDFLPRCFGIRSGNFLQRVLLESPNLRATSGFHEDEADFGEDEDSISPLLDDLEVQEPYRRTQPKVGRNEPLREREEIQKMLCTVVVGGSRLKVRPASHALRACHTPIRAEPSRTYGHVMVPFCTLGHIMVPTAQKLETTPIGNKAPSPALRPIKVPIKVPAVAKFWFQSHTFIMCSTSFVRRVFGRPPECTRALQRGQDRSGTIK